MKLSRLSVFSISFLLALIPIGACLAQGKNSTKKVRVRPSQLASKIGQGVNWVDSIETAMQESARSGKPIFWYVPTIHRSFMDRKPVLDRYMMAGPFSWLSTIELLNTQFVPVKAIPNAALAKKYDLQPFKFIEPGFLVLLPSGEQKLRVDRINTFHEQWFNGLLLSELDKEVALADESLALELSKQMRSAANMFRQGKHSDAKAAWKKIAESNPDHPLGWKAAAESEGFGPIVRGFEVSRKIPKAALRAGIQSAGSTAPAGSYDEATIIRRSTEFLLSMQREDGGWVDSDYDFGGTDSLPNVHVAVTSLSAMALMQVSKDLPDHQPEIDAAITKAARYVTDQANINTADRDEILWAYAYRLRFISRLCKTGKDYQEQLQECVEALERIQTKRGSWYHEYSNPFVTATALSALAEARDCGAIIDSARIKSGLAALQKDRFDNGAYPYGSSRAPRDDNRGTDRDVAASAGRMPLCELGLFSWKASDEKRLVRAIETSFDLHKHLASALKYDDHTSNLAYGGFFFWYDMRGRSEAISRITDDEIRDKFQAQQKSIVMSLPELDGCFVDSHELGRCYGTAMALLCLKLIR